MFTTKFQEIEKCDVIWQNLSHVAKLIFWVIDIMWKSELISFQNFLLGFPLILVSKVTDVQRPWKIKKSIRIMMLISFILPFHFLRHVTGFHRLHHKYSTYQTQSWQNFLNENVERKRCYGTFPSWLAHIDVHINYHL